MKIEDMKKYVIDYYENTRQYYGKYHDHKEISAWSGLVAHILFCTFIVLANPTVQTIQSKFLMTIGFTISVIVESKLLLIYIRNQLDLKDMGGSYVAGSLSILAELIDKDYNGKELREYLRVKERKEKKYQSTYVLPNELLERAKKYSSKGTGAQDLTRKMNTKVLIISAISVIFYRWIIIW